MTKDEIATVQESWRSAAPVKYVAAELFYVKLFELDPTLKLLFSDHPKMRQRKFLQLMDATVNGLERADVLLPVVRELGMRHPLFGDSDEHHGTVGAALMWVLEKCLRRDLTPALRSAWIKTFGVLSQTLLTSSWENTSQAA